MALDLRFVAESERGWDTKVVVPNHDYFEIAQTQLTKLFFFALE